MVKLSPRYVDHYKISNRVKKVAYEFELAIKLSMVHLVFHVSMLKKYIGVPVSILHLKLLEVSENICYEEISSKFLRINHLVEGST